MKLYLITISIVVSAILGINIPLTISKSLPLSFMFLTFLKCLLFVAIPAVVITIASHLLPKSLFNPFKKCFYVKDKELKFYNKLQVRKWKDKIPELGSLSGFAKKKLADPNNPEYIFKFLLENCIADVLHTVSMIVPIVMFFFIPKVYILTMALPLFLTNFVLHFMPRCVQRFLRPKMIKLYKRLERKTEQQTEETLVLEK